MHLFFLTFRFPLWTEWRVWKYFEGFGTGSLMWRLKEWKRAIKMRHIASRHMHMQTLYLPLAYTSPVEDRYSNRDENQAEY